MWPRLLPIIAVEMRRAVPPNYLETNTHHQHYHRCQENEGPEYLTWIMIAYFKITIHNLHRRGINEDIKGTCQMISSLGAQEIADVKRKLT